jgi:hypothetical protein
MGNCAFDQLDIADQILASSCLSPPDHTQMSSLIGAVGYVYAISPIGHSPCKIGCAQNINVRLSELQCGAWALLVCEGALAVMSGSAVVLEQAAHKIAARESKRITGEWFEIEPINAIASAILAARILGFSVASPSQLFATLEGERVTQRVSEESERRRSLRIKLGMDPA